MTIAIIEKTGVATENAPSAFRPVTPRVRLTTVPLNAFPLDQGLELALAARVEDPADVVEARMARRDLATAMASLPEIQRQVVVFRLGLDEDLDLDRSWPTVAAGVGLTVHSARRAFRDATLFLRASLVQPEFALAA